MERPKFLAVIPARGGSKGIPGKNIKKVAGKPLIAWTIEAAAASKLLDAFAVSTDDAGIKKVSESFGSIVIDRPAELATDKATTLSVVQHILTKIDAENIVILQPTSPVRDRDLIDRCIKRFLETGADNLATGFICKFMEYGSYSARRQELKGFFYDDGNVYVIKSDLIKKGTLHGSKEERFEISKDQNFEIDNDFDMWLDEQILLKRVKEGRQ